MNDVSRRRWENFKANRRGFWSLCIFIALYGVSLFAEVIANDRPIVMKHNQEIFFPVFNDYTEKDLGGEHEMLADFRDPHVQELISGPDNWQIWPPIPYNYKTIDYQIETAVPAPPSSRHLLGTDDGAKDTLARLLYGFRLSVSFGLVLTILASCIGILVGAFQGYYGGNIDLIGQRLVEVWQGLPVLFVLIILASIIEPSVMWLLFILLLFSWTGLVAVVRAEFLRVRNFEFVRAARAMGVSNPVIMWRHVLPNAMVATLTFLPFILNGSITTLTALDFLGFGLPPGSASLGELLAQGQANVRAPWLGLTAFAVLGTSLVLLIFVGEAVRDAFDPRKLVQRQQEESGAFSPA